MSNTETIVTEAMSTEGAAIAKIVTERRSMFKGDIAAKGYIVRLGNLMVELEAAAKQAGKKKVTSKMIKEAGLSSVSSAIRCEAKWFVLNEKVAREFIKASRKGYTNVSSLKSDMAEADKAAKAAEKAEAVTEGESDSEAGTEGEAAESETTQAAKLEITVETIVLAINVVAKREGQTIEQVLTDVIDAIEAPLTGSTQPSVAA